MKKIICLSLLFLVVVNGFAQQQSEEIKDTAIIRLLKKIKIAKEDTVKVKVLYDLGYKFLYIDPNKAEMYAKQAILLSNKLNFKKGLSTSYNVLAIKEQGKGNYDLAVDYFLKALKIAEEEGEKKQIGLFHLNLGKCYLEMKEKKNFLLHQEKAISVFAEIGDSVHLAACYGDIGIYYFNAGDTSKTSFYFKKQIDIAKRIGDKFQLAAGYVNATLVIDKVKNFDSLVFLFDRVIEMFAEQGNKKALAIALCNKANAYKEVEKIKTSVELFNKSIEVAKEIDFKNLISHIYEQLYYIHVYIEDYKKANEYLLLRTDLERELKDQEKLNKVSELEIKYQTEKKEQELILKEKDIELLEKNKTTKNYLLIGLLLLLLLTGAIALLWIRNHKQKQREVELKNVALEQKLLRLQMNPHFIFNSLSSISGQMLQNLNLAREYLAKFARLMRLILENSREAYVAMKNEVDALNYYLILEQQRFKEKFDFKMEIDPTINLDELEIPPMLIQPHIENAILHGVTPGEKKGMITVRFIKESETKVRCEVEDNGIGRKKAGENKKAGGVVLHKSLALEITQERLKTLGEETHQTLSFKIDDLEDENHAPLGTRVTLTLPSREV